MLGNHIQSSEENTKTDNKKEKISNSEYGEKEIINIANKVNKVKGFISKHNYQFRICLIGDSFVGKTSLLKRYYDKSFSEDHSATIACDFKVVTLETDYKIIKMQIWDTAGQERFRAISINYFRSAHGFIFIFDITRKDTFLNLESWITTAFSINKDSICNIIIGNKRDDDENREVSQDEAIQLAKRYNMAYLETSAKENDNVETMIHFLSYMLCEKYSSQINKFNLGTDEDSLHEGKNLDLLIKNDKKCIC